MSILSNPPENACFGCGPANPHGLQLQMSTATAEDGSPAVTCAFTPNPEQSGWPGLAHSGIHFAVLYDLSYWAAMTFAGKIMLGEPDMAFRALKPMDLLGRLALERAKTMPLGAPALRRSLRRRRPAFAKLPLDESRLNKS